MSTTLSIKAYLAAKDVSRRLRDNSDGVTLLEYSIMIGLITALVIGMVTEAGTFVDTAWTDLTTVLPP